MTQKELTLRERFKSNCPECSMFVYVYGEEYKDNSCCAKYAKETRDSDWYKQELDKLQQTLN